MKTIYEVLTSEGRCVEVERDVWLQFPASHRRTLSRSRMTGLWPGRVIEIFGERYRVELVSEWGVKLAPAPGEDSSL